MKADELEGGLKADSPLSRTLRRTEAGLKADRLKTSGFEGGRIRANRRRTDNTTLEGCVLSGFRSRSLRPQSWVANGPELLGSLAQGHNRLCTHSELTARTHVVSASLGPAEFRSAGVSTADAQLNSAQFADLRTGDQPVRSDRGEVRQ